MSVPDKQATHAIVLSDDLIFTSRIVGTGRCLGLTIRSAPSVERMLQDCEANSTGCLILDLQNPGLDISSLLQTLQNTSSKPFLVAYGSHVNTTALKNAREAGCDVVVPRSKFVEELPTALPHWCAGRATSA